MVMVVASVILFRSLGFFFRWFRFGRSFRFVVCTQLDSGEETGEEQNVNRLKRAAEINR